MRVVEVTEPGPPESLSMGQRPVPVPTAADVLVKVTAAGVNRADIMQRYGNYPPPPGASDVLGLEVSGTVVALGEAVSGWNVGDRVCGLVTGGGYAEYCVVPGPQCLPLPINIDLVDGGALAEACLTVWTNVFERGRLREGGSFLVHGGSSGIGTTAIQLARLSGVRVFATAGSPEKCQACEKLGAERAINYRDEDFTEVVRTATDGRGVDVILDMVGRRLSPAEPGYPRHGRASRSDRTDAWCEERGQSGQADVAAPDAHRFHTAFAFGRPEGRRGRCGP